MNKNPTHLPIGEKIRQIRQAKGLSQDNLAKNVGKSKALISRLERGESEFDNETLTAIKKALGIEKAPLTERELEIYWERLWGWHAFVHARRMDKAKGAQEELKQIIDLPFETELIMLYKLIDARILFINREDTAVEERLADVEASIDLEQASDELLYLYHRVKGGALTAATTRTTNSPTFESMKERLNHFLLAYEYSEKMQISDPSLLFSIGNNYLFSARPIMAMRYLEQAKREYDMDKTLDYPIAINSLLAVCYDMLGEYTSAIKLNEAMYAEAIKHNNPYHIGTALLNIGISYGQDGDTDSALRYIEESIPFFGETINQASEAVPQSIEDAHAATFLYVCALCNKAIYLMKKKDTAGCKAALEKAMDLAKDFEVLTMEVETTRHMTLKEENSTEYLESVALPYFRDQGARAITNALGICDDLESTYRKRGATNKANAIAAIARDIYKQMIFGVLDK